MGFSKNIRSLIAISIGLIFGFLMGKVHAVSFTIDLTTAEVATANWKWNQVDPSHVQFATVQLFGQDWIKNKDIAEWENQRIALLKSQTAVCILWNASSQATKDSVCTASGNPTGCVIPGC